MVRYLYSTNKVPAEVEFFAVPIVPHHHCSYLIIAKVQVTYSIPYCNDNHVGWLDADGVGYQRLTHLLRNLTVAYVAKVTIDTIA